MGNVMYILIPLKTLGKERQKTETVNSKKVSDLAQLRILHRVQCLLYLTK